MSSEIIILCTAAFAAGFIDAMVGGGGLIQLPALFILQPQLGLVQTLATNKLASFLGTSVSAVRYVKRVPINWRHLSPAIITAMLGAFGGGLLVSYIHKEQFMPFIICVLVLVLFYTIFKRELGLHHVDKQVSKKRYYVYAVATGGIIGFYEGLIGPGAGSFLIFAFVVVFGYNFLHASANAKIINLSASSGALLFFIYKGFIIWQLAILIGLANMPANV